MCEGLFRQHQTFLNLPHSPALAAAFVAMVQDHYNYLKEEGAAPAAEVGRLAEEGGGESGGKGGHGRASEADAGPEEDDEGTSIVVRLRGLRFEGLRF